MPATSPCAPSCCVTTQTVNVPGLAGASGLNGTNGINATTLTTQNFVVPAIGATVGVSVVSSVWMVVGQIVIASGPANFIVATVPTTTSATLQFLGYPGDVAPGVTINTGATISPAGLQGGGWNTLAQKLDQSVINSTTVVNSTNLQFFMQANTNYRVRGVIFFDSTAAGNFKYDFFGPAAPTLVRAERSDCIGGGTPAERALDVVIPGSTSLTGGGTTGGFIRFEMIFQNAANAAVFSFQFAQNTATADTGAILRAGSWMEYATV
jgi:hypothetical protein